MKKPSWSGISSKSGDGPKASPELFSCQTRGNRWSFFGNEGHQRDNTGHYVRHTRKFPEGGCKTSFRVHISFQVIQIRSLPAPAFLLRWLAGEREHEVSVRLRFSTWDLFGNCRKTTSFLIRTLPNKWQCLFLRGL